MQCADFRLQSTSFPPNINSGANLIGLYFNGSGIPMTVISGNVNRQAWGWPTGSFTNNQIVTGFSVQTGVMYGASGANITGLGTPTQWISVFSTAGKLLAIPAYDLR